MNFEVNPEIIVSRTSTEFSKEILYTVSSPNMKKIFNFISADFVIVFQS